MKQCLTTLDSRLRGNDDIYSQLTNHF
jgi:hypothetical protein